MDKNKVFEEAKALSDEDRKALWHELGATLHHKDGGVHTDDDTGSTGPGPKPKPPGN